MSEEIALADANMAEIARLTIAITSLRRTITQQQGEIELIQRVLVAARGVMEQGSIGGYTRMVLADAIATYDMAMKASTTP